MSATSPPLPDSPIPFASDSNDPFIYTSIRYDPILMTSPANTAASFRKPSPFYLLEHHWTRLQVAKWSTTGFEKNSSCSPNNFLSSPPEFLRGLLLAVKQWQQTHPKEAEWAESLRIRWRMYPNGRITSEIWQIPRKSLHCFFPKSLDLPENAVASTDWTVVLDYQATEANESTMFKTSDRSEQGRARSAAGITNLNSPKEVLLYDTNGSIIDGSNSTPYFYRNGRWVTPSSTSGGLQGTTRRWSLETGICFEEVIHKDSMQLGEVVWFSNAVRGYFWAVYQLRDQNSKGPSNDAQYQHVISQLR